ncbi:hypothetical protein [Kocuria rosea]|uniref:hypothetical protein n=1 Tax=Kocuria rosea TaxID=1275 RepID=UPI0011A2A1FE|nr:hypothetical protein [Kocuria rosea]
MTPAPSPSWSQGLQDLLSGLGDLLVAVPAWLPTGVFTLLAVVVTLIMGHRHKFTEWSWDRTFESLADIDAMHRELVQSFTKLANDARVSGKVTDEKELGRNEELSTKFTSAMAKCRLLTRNRAVRKQLDGLQEATMAVVEHLYNYRGADRAKFVTTYRELISTSSAKRDNLVDSIAGRFRSVSRRR